VKQQPRPRGAIRVDVVVCSVELFLCHTWKLDTDTDCQDDSLPRVTGQRDPKARRQPLPSDATALRAENDIELRNVPREECSETSVRCLKWTTR